MRDEDHIGPINGHTNRGPDIMANGCLWVVGIFFAFIVIFGGYGFYADWRKAREQCPPEWQCVGPKDTRATNCKCWDSK